MTKAENIFISALKVLVRTILRVFYGDKFKEKKAMHEINFLAPKSDSFFENKKKKSA